MYQIAESLRRHGGSIWVSFVLVGLIVAGGFLFMQLADLSGPVKGASLPLFAIGGMILLILLLTVVAMIFSTLGLANQAQAMGLPEGSIRAVIALSLIVLFAILSVFLYKSVSEGKVNTVAQLSDTDRKQFIRDHANLPDIQSDISKDKKEQQITAKGADGKILKNEDGTPQYLYDVTYSGTTNAASQDFAKQLLVLLGTLMTAITSFYLGAGTATSAAAVGQAGATPKPTISGIDPDTHLITSGLLHLKIMGANLNIMTNAKIIRAGVQFVATNVKSNTNVVSCDIDVSKATAGDWDVVVDDGGSKSVSLPGALKLS